MQLPDSVRRTTLPSIPDDGTYVYHGLTGRVSTDEGHVIPKKWEHVANLVLTPPCERALIHNMFAPDLLAGDSRYIFTRPVFSGGYNSPDRINLAWRIEDVTVGGGRLEDAVYGYQGVVSTLCDKHQQPRALYDITGATNLEHLAREIGEPFLDDLADTLRAFARVITLKPEETFEWVAGLQAIYTCALEVLRTVGTGLDLVDSDLREADALAACVDPRVLELALKRITRRASRNPFLAQLTRERAADKAFRAPWRKHDGLAWGPSITQNFLRHFTKDALTFSLDRLSNFSGEVLLTGRYPVASATWVWIPSPTFKSDLITPGHWVRPSDLPRPNGRQRYVPVTWG